jgi:hypothetical protein
VVLLSTICINLLFVCFLFFSPFNIVIKYLYPMYSCQFYCPCPQSAQNFPLPFPSLTEIHHCPLPHRSGEESWVGGPCGPHICYTCPHHCALVVTSAGGYQGPLLVTSTHDPPCKQWLTGLGAGAGSSPVVCLRQW